VVVLLAPLAVRVQLAGASAMRTATGVQERRRSIRPVGAHVARRQPVEGAGAAAVHGPASGTLGHLLRDRQLNTKHHRTAFQNLEPDTMLESWINRNHGLTGIMD
jgi:hypothetical protein